MMNHGYDTGKKSESKGVVNKTVNPLKNAATAQLQDNRKKSILQKKQLDELNNAHNGEIVTQKKENNTGLPDNLKTGVENLSGMAMDDVKVHYNSDRPAQLNAHAYAQGTDIHVAPGQEKHLPHEAWHVVQQKQGRVKPTLQMKTGVPANDDKGLEKEADVMGGKAAQMKAGNILEQYKKQVIQSKAVFQLKLSDDDAAALYQYYMDKYSRIIPPDVWHASHTEIIESSVDLVKAKENVDVEIGRLRRSGGGGGATPEAKHEERKSGARKEDEHKEGEVKATGGGSGPTHGAPPGGATPLTQAHAHKLAQAVDRDPELKHAHGGGGGGSSGGTQISGERTRREEDDGVYYPAKMPRYEPAMRAKLQEVSAMISAGHYEKAYDRLIDKAWAKSIGIMLEHHEAREDALTAALNNKSFASTSTIELHTPEYLQGRGWLTGRDAKKVLLMHLEEYMHQYQAHANKFLSPNTVKFKQAEILPDLSERQKGEKNPLRRSDYDEIDVMAQMHDWGFDVEEIEYVERYREREVFWKWLNDPDRKSK